ncbi:E3 ubiquitin-protein ligase TRIM7-like [Pogona vitticeps]
MERMELIKQFREEATFSICLEYFKDPVVINCGHNFCQTCLTRCWENLGTEASCPQCRQTVLEKKFRPNRQLAGVVGVVQKLLVRRQAQGEKAMCEKHQEPLKLFCQNDLAPICDVCHSSEMHQDHSVLPVEEASQKCKEKIQAWVKVVKEERAKLVVQDLAEQKRSQTSLKQLEEEKKIILTFEKMQTFLDEKSSYWLACLEDLKGKFEEKQQENVTRLSTAFASLDKLISKIEEKCQQPTSEFLQDIKNTLDRCEQKPGMQLAELSGLEETLKICSRRNSALEEAIQKYKGNPSRAFHDV